MTDAARPIWTRRVRAAVDVKGPCRAVLYALADRADEDGRAWPGQAQIALDAGLTDRTVRDALKALHLSGYLSRDGSKYGADVWRLTLDESGAATGDRHAAPTTGTGLRKDRKRAPVRNGAPAEAGSGATGSGLRSNRNGAPDAPERGSYKEPIEEPMKDPMKNPRAPADAAADVRKPREDVQRVWDLLRSLDTTVKRHKSPPKGWGIAQRIDEHGEDVVALVVEWAFTAPAYVKGRQTRAGFLRETEHCDRTLFRETNLPEYAVFAQKWAALGRPTDRPAVTRPAQRTPDDHDSAALMVVSFARNEGADCVAETFTDDVMAEAIASCGGIDALCDALDDPEKMDVYRERLAAELRGRLEAA